MPGQAARLFGAFAICLVRIWDILPPAFVESVTVSRFQTLLNRTLQLACKRSLQKWDKLFSPHPGSHELTYCAFDVADGL